MNSLAMPVLLIVLAWLLWPRRAGTRAAHVLNRGRQAPDWRELLAADPLAAARELLSTGRGADVDRELLLVVEALAGALRAGLPPGQALALAATDVKGSLAAVLAGADVDGVDWEAYAGGSSHYRERFA